MGFIKIWKPFKLTEKQLLKIKPRQLRCPCGQIHDHVLWVERFFIFVRYKGWGRRPFTPLKWIYKLLPT